MTQASPPVGRAIAVLNFLAEHGDEAFTLTEIAKSLRISMATCHSVLSALSESGYVFRTVGKTYVLGPALDRVAQASRAPNLILHVVRPELRLLADEFDAVCAASELVGSEIVMRARAASISHLNWHPPSLQSFPAPTPHPSVFMAGEDEAGMERWLAGLETPLDEEGKEGVRQGHAFLRTHGFSFGVRKLPLSDPDRARELQLQSAVTEYGVASIEPDHRYQLAYVAAPVILLGGEVAFSVSLSGFTGPVLGRGINKIGGRLREACGRIEAFMAGREFG